MKFLRKMIDIVTLWEASVILCFCFILLDIPLGAAFQHIPTVNELVLDLFTSGMLLWDTYRHGNRIQSYRYSKAWATLNWISCLPYMSMVLLSSDEYQHWTIYLQAFKLIRLPGLIYLMIERGKKHLVPNLFKFLAATLITLTAINAFACGWLVIYPPLSDPITDYNKALYWLITTIATVGYGDITPNTNGGRIYAMGMMILGATIWGILIASASRMMLASDRRKERKKEKMAALHSFFTHYEVPRQLQEQVIGFFNHLWSRKMSEDEHAVISELPSALQTELQTYMNLKPISRVSLFKGVSFECLASASKKLEQAFFSPNEKIISKGENGNEMYLIGHGTVIIHIGSQYITTLGEGTCFGEMALIGDGLRTTDVTASSYCDVFKLSREKFEELFAAHADLRTNIEKIVQERKKNESLSKESKNKSAA